MSSEAGDAHPLPPGFRVSTDPADLDLDYVHHFLAEESYWARGISRELLERAVKGSLCFALLGPDGGQLGFARVITDRATFAWLADVFVAGTERRQGLGKGLVAAVFAHPDLQNLRRFMLVTADAHGLYARFGFETPVRPERLMERLDPAVRAVLARTS